MNYLTDQLLNSEQLDAIRKTLDKEDLCWEDGKKTAGTHASLVKNNLQLDRNSEVSIKFSQPAEEKLRLFITQKGSHSVGLISRRHGS